MSEELAKLIHVPLLNQLLPWLKRHGSWDFALLSSVGIKGISLHMGMPHCALKSLQCHALRVCLRNEEICLYATVPIANKI